MSDLFSQPIVVSVVNGASFKPKSKSRVIKTHVLWLNDAPKKIKAAAENQNNKELVSYYKINPFDMPIPPIMSNGFNSIIGGDEEFSLDEINDALATYDASKDIAINRQTRSTEFTLSKNINYVREISVCTDHWVFPEDNMYTFKKKIQLVTNIPMIRQHIWYESGGSVFSPCYEVQIDGKRIKTNIWEIRNAKTFIMGIPVDPNWYATRSKIRVLNNEPNVLIGSIYDMSPDAQWFVLDLNDILKSHRQQFSDSITTDVYIRELVYYSFIIRYWPMITNNVFQMFVTNEASVREEYPELLHSNNSIKKRIELETLLISKNYMPSTSKYPMDVFLSSTNISTASEHFSYGEVVNLRNLFDNLATSYLTPYVICRTIINYGMYTLTKQMKGGQLPRHKLQPAARTIIIMHIIPDVGEMFLHININGTYNVHTSWREDKKITIDMAYQYMVTHVNPLIKIINNMGENVTVRPLTLIKIVNINMINANLVMSVKKQINMSEFDILKSNMQKYKDVGIISISSSDANSVSFYLHKGMYNYDNARFNSISNVYNAYSYNTSTLVRQKWESIFIRQKACVLQNRTSDIYIKATGLKDGEYSSFVRSMLQLIHMSTNTTSLVVEKHNTGSVISQFKEIDPILYDLKKIYNSKKKYSQLCQKPNQPIIVTSATKKSVEYWNFTTNTPAYYECPTTKFPILYFKSGVHPKKYCMPCCKKAALTKGSKHERISLECIKNRMYDSKIKNVSKSGYVVAYGKPLEDGRLSKLPESSLDQLFYKQYSSSGHSPDDECIPNMGYYIYGIPQSVGLIQNIGIVMILANAMSMTLAKLIEETVNRIIKNKSKWNLIMNGRIVTYFKSALEFTTAISAAFSTNEEQIMFDLWNEAFIDIARIFWGINFIQFIDGGAGSINIMVPSHVKNVDEYLVPQLKHIIVIEKMGKYLPIYLINITTYKKTGTVENAIFNHDHAGIVVLRNMIIHVIEKLENMGAPDLSRIEKFVDDTKNIDIVNIFINRKNVCYAVMLQVSNLDIYFPVVDSLHDHVDIKKVALPFDHTNYTATWSDLNNIMLLYNEWAKKNEHTSISIAEWVVVNNNIIGVMDQHGIYCYYVAQMSLPDALAIYDIPVTRLQYHPFFINKIINKNEPPKKDEAFLSQSIYTHYLYQLFILEFTSVINRMSNVDLRKNVKSIIKKYINNPAAFISKLQTLLSKWPNDYEMILGIFLQFTKSTNIKGSESIYDALIGYKNTSYTYNDIASIIDNSRFMFDNIWLFQMFEMKEDNLIIYLKNIMDPIIEVTNSDPKITTLSNFFASCFSQQVESEHCNNNKLIVKKTKYEQYLVFLAKDILNPIKRRQLLNPSIKSITMEFRFITRLNENIFVST
jgi:hypothetical protein